MQTTKNVDEWFADRWRQSVMQPFAQPWTKSSFALDLKHYEDQFAWYHLVNVMLHVFASAYLYALIFRISWRLARQESLAADPYKVAFVSAALFAAHPLACQAVSYISARSPLLTGANFFLALNAFLIGYFGKGPAAKGWGYGIAFLAFFMCLSSGLAAAALPFTALLLCFLLKPKETHWFDQAIDRPFVTGVMIILSILTLIWPITGYLPAGAPNWFGRDVMDVTAYYATQAKALFTYYLRMFFVPIGLSIDPPFAKAPGLVDPFAWIGMAGIVVALIAAFLQRRRPIVLLGGLLLLAGWLPYALVVQTDAVNDSFLYTSLSGLCVLGAVGLLRLVQLPLPQSCLAFGAIIAVLSGLTIWRTLDWQSDSALIQSTLKTNPNSGLAHVLRSFELANQEKYTEAEKEANDAAAVEPSYAMAFIAKGSVLNATGQVEKARDAFLTAVRLAQKQHLPPQILAQANLGLAEANLKSKRLEQVPALIGTSLPFITDRDKVRANYLMGLLSFEHKKYNEAKTFFKRVASLGRTYKEAWYYLARTHWEMKEYAEAERAAMMGAALNPTVETKLFSGKVLLVRNDLANSREALKFVIKKDPQSAEALALLSLVEERAGEKALASSYRKDALALDPGIFSKLELPTLPKVPEKK